MHISIHKDVVPTTVSKDAMLYDVIYKDSDGDFVIRVQEPIVYNGNGDILVAIDPRNSTLKLYGFKECTSNTVEAVSSDMAITLVNLG
jgi:hypothetical protein